MSKQGRFLDLCEWISLGAVLVLVAVCLGRWRSEVPAEPERTAATLPSAASGQPDVALDALPVREGLRIRQLERLLEEARTREATLQARAQALQQRIDECRQALDAERARCQQIPAQSELRAARSGFGQEFTEMKASFLCQQIERREDTRASDRVDYVDRIGELESRWDQLRFDLLVRPTGLERELQEAHARIDELLKEKKHLSERNDYLTCKVSELSQTINRLNRHIDYLTTGLSY